MRTTKSKSADVPNPADIVEPGSSVISKVGFFRADESRLAVHVGSKRVAVISSRDADLVEPGQPWTDELAGKLFEAAQTLAALRHALRMLSARAKSRRALQTQLLQRGHDARAVQHAIDRLEQAKLLDDETLAAHAAESLVRKGGTGRRAIEAKLRTKGIDANIARAAATEATSEFDERAEAVRLATHRAERMDPRLDPQQRARRLFGWLARRGFDSSDARHAVETALRSTQQEPDDSSFEA